MYFKSDMDQSDNGIRAGRVNSHIRLAGRSRTLAEQRRRNVDTISLQSRRRFFVLRFCPGKRRLKRAPATAAHDPRCGPSETSPQCRTCLKKHHPRPARFSFHFRNATSAGSVLSVIRLNYPAINIFFSRSRNSLPTGLSGCCHSDVTCLFRFTVFAPPVSHRKRDFAPQQGHFGLVLQGKAAPARGPGTEYAQGASVWPMPDHDLATASFSV